jgi:hypothetical protein
MGRAKIAALSAVITTLAVVVVGGFVLWLAMPREVAGPAANHDLSQLAQIEPPAAPQQNPPLQQNAAPATSAGGRQAQPATAVNLSDGVQLFPLAHRAYAAAYDVESGHLLVAARNDNQADLYDTSSGAQLITSTAAPTKPTVVAAKQLDGKPLFVVGGEVEPRLDVLDGTTGAVVKSVTTSTPNFVRVTGDPRSDKPHVYYVTKDNEPVGRLNLQTLTEESAPPADDDSVLFSKRPSMDAFPVDAYGAYAAVDRKIVASDLESELGAMEFRVSAFIPGTPWVAGVKSTDICVGSINSFRTLGSVPLPEEFFQSRDQIEDPRRVRRPMRTAVKRGDPSPQLELTIRKVDPSVEVKALTLPTGMTFEGDLLKWAPAGNQLGPHPIKLEARADKFRREYNLQLKVSRPVIDLPFVARRVALSSDGAKAVVWGFDKPEPNSGHRQDSYDPKQQLGVVDVAARRVLASRKMPRGIQSAAVDENGVYVVLRNSEAGFPAEVHQLSLADLSVIKTASTEKPVEEREAAVVLIGDKVLAFGEEKFSLPSLERMPNPYASSDPRYQYLQQPRGGTEDYGDVIWSSGILWDKELTHPQLLVNPPCFVGLPLNDQNVQWHRPQTKWGRHAWLGTLEGPNGSSLIPASHTRYGPLMLWDLPVAVMFKWDSPPMPRLIFRELVSGTETQTIDLGHGPYRDESHENGDLLKSAGSVIAACVSGQLHIISLDEVDKSRLKPPFRVALKQSMVLDNDRKATLHYKLLDGQPPYQLKMTIGNAKFSAENQQDGTIEIDTTQFATELQQTAREAIQNLASSPDDKAADRVLDYIAYATPLFEKITGRKPEGVPCMVPVRLEVTDKELNVARLTHAYLCELPQAKIVKEVDAHLASTRQLRQQAMERRKSRGVVTVRESPAKPDKQAKAASSLRRDEREKLLRELAADYASVLLKRNPPEKVLNEEIDAAAKVARDSADRVFVENLEKRKAATKGGMRKWSDNNGHTTTAALQDVFADQVVLSRQSGGQVTVPIEKLSAADQEFIKSSQEASAGVRPEEYVPAQMELLMRGISAHGHQMLGYPPAYLQDADGSRQLSWRVLILPYIGGQRLFDLFRLDEPWDSEHNRKLLKYRPGVFSTLDEEISATHTTMLALRAKGSLVADSTPVSPNDVSDSLESIMVLAEVKADKAVEWTRPDDIDEAMFDQISEWLEDRDGKTYVGMANVTVRSMPSDTPAEELRKAVNVADDAEGDVKFDDAIAAAGGRPSAATQPRSKASRRNDRVDRSLEEIPIGNFILSEEKPDEKLFGPEETVGGLKVRAVPFRDDGSPGSAACVVSPEGMIYGVIGPSLLRFDPAKGRVEAQATLRLRINSIHWCFGKLLLVGDLGKYHEYQTDSGAWRRLDLTKADPNVRSRYTHGMHVWIVDPSTLKTLRGFVVPGNRVSCAANSARVLAMHGHNVVNRIDLVDLKRGEQLTTLPRRTNDGGDELGNNDAVGLYDVAIMPDGESAIAMDGGRLSQIEFAENGMAIREGTATYSSNQQFGLPHLFLSADMQFAAVLSQSLKPALPEGRGFLVFKTPEFGSAYGGISTRNHDREGVMAMDAERRIVYVADESGKLRVLRGKEEKTYEGLPPGCKRIVPVPGREEVLMLGKYSVLASIPGEAEAWAFEPAAK